MTIVGSELGVIDTKELSEALLVQVLCVPVLISYVVSITWPARKTKGERGNFPLPHCSLAEASGDGVECLAMKIEHLASSIRERIQTWRYTLDRGASYLKVKHSKAADCLK